MEKNQFFVDSAELSEKVLEKKRRLERDPSSRKNHMEYMDGMERISSDIMDQVLGQMRSYDPAVYTDADVKNALMRETCGVEDLKALLSPAALPRLEEMAVRAREETGKHFGNTVYLFTPLYIANYCENYCVYCGFNCYNDIVRKKLAPEEIEHEMQIIAASGMEEILLLTGESRGKSSVEYIGEACKTAAKYFRNVGLEIYPVNTPLPVRCMCTIFRKNILMWNILSLVRAFVRSLTMTELARRMFMKKSFVRSYVHIAFFCHMWGSLYLPGNRSIFGTGL